ncbi:MAG: hypothetical protein RR356_01100 [Bacteroidales bacterium]
MPRYKGKFIAAFDRCISPLCFKQGKAEGWFEKNFSATFLSYNPLFFLEKTTMISTIFSLEGWLYPPFEILERRAFIVD